MCEGLASVGVRGRCNEYGTIERCRVGSASVGQGGMALRSGQKKRFVGEQLRLSPVTFSGQAVGECKVKRARGKAFQLG